MHFLGEHGGKSCSSTPHDRAYVERDEQRILFYEYVGGARVSLLPVRCQSDKVPGRKNVLPYLLASAHGGDRSRGTP